MSILKLASHSPFLHSKQRRPVIIVVFFSRARHQLHFHGSQRWPQQPEQGKHPLLIFSRLFRPLGVGLVQSVLLLGVEHPPIWVPELRPTLQKHCFSKKTLSSSTFGLLFLLSKPLSGRGGVWLQRSSHKVRYVHFALAKKSERSKCFVLVGGYPVATIPIEEAKFHLYLSVTCAACIGTFEAGNVYF